MIDEHTRVSLLNIVERSGTARTRPPARETDLGLDLQVERAVHGARRRQADGVMRQRELTEAHGHSTFNANDCDEAGRKQSTASDPTVATGRASAARL